MSITQASEAHPPRPHVRVLLLGVIAVVAVLLAGAAGYALAPGFTAESSPGQQVSNRVLNAYATGDAASIVATYDPAVKVILIYDGTEHVIASNIEEQTGVIKDAIAIGETLKQIGPVSTYEAANGDLYVAHTLELTSPYHPDGIPLIGFYRVHNGKVIRQIGIDTEHY